jgi:hypothetical protein
MLVGAQRFASEKLSIGTYRDLTKRGVFVGLDSSNLHGPRILRRAHSSLASYRADILVK